ncbi:hypothetical protein F444_19998 [Phytophthora nicotianae P1976]|uniref:Uncharacterized protein n=1 Tax=Phytophthora nicotianae P1976 TaxID=1317066 RepID=A0A080Z5Z3_PHYNI|nr:hypothetical protein F444_19998 [Phytophthora nicotianae P1976]
MTGTVATVSCVLRRQASADSLQDVGQLISDFLGPDPNLSLSEACAFRSLPLLNWIWRVSCESTASRTSQWTLNNYLRSDPKYYQWQFQKAAIVAASNGHLDVLKWLFEHFSGCWTPVMVPEAAAKNGDVAMLQFLLQHDAGRAFKYKRVEIPLESATSFETRPQLQKNWKGPGNVVYWGGRCIAFAMRGNNFEAAKWIYQYSPHSYSGEDIMLMIQWALTAGNFELAEVFLPRGRKLLGFAVGCPHLDVLKMVIEAGILRFDEAGAAETVELLVPHGRLVFSSSTHLLDLGEMGT